MQNNMHAKMTVTIKSLQMRNKIQHKLIREVSVLKSTYFKNVFWTTLLKTNHQTIFQQPTKASLNKHKNTVRQNFGLFILQVFFAIFCTTFEKMKDKFSVSFTFLEFDEPKTCKIKTTNEKQFFSVLMENNSHFRNFS